METISRDCLVIDQAERSASRHIKKWKEVEEQFLSIKLYHIP